jgi:hypothetical protein
VSWGISIDKGLCGPHTLPALIGGAVAYVGAAASALQKRRLAAGLWLFALLGWGIVLGLLLVLPGTHGYCET